MGTETWYVMEDGSYADPQDVSSDKKGILRHKDGRAVAMRGDVPSSRSVDPDEERKKAVKTIRVDARPATKDDPLKSDRQMKAEGGHGYKTR